MNAIVTTLQKCQTPIFGGYKCNRNTVVNSNECIYCIKRPTKNQIISYHDKRYKTCKCTTPTEKRIHIFQYPGEGTR